MKEKELIKSELCNIKKVSIIITIIGTILSILVFYIIASNWKSFRESSSSYCQAHTVTIRGQKVLIPKDEKKCEELKKQSLSSFIVEDNQNSYWIALITIIFLTIAIAVLYYKAFSQEQIIITNKRIYGEMPFGKKFNLPINNISSIELCIMKGITIQSYSNKVKFKMINNNDEIYKVLSKLIIKNN